MRRAALALLVLASIAGCSSTVLLGTLTTDGGTTDLARPSDGFDAGRDGFDGGGHGDGFDGSIADFGADGGALIDLAP